LGLKSGGVVVLRRWVGLLGNGSDASGGGG